MMKRSKINILLCDTFPGLLPPEIPSYSAQQRLQNHKALYIMSIGRNVENMDMLLRFDYSYERVALAYDSLKRYCKQMPNIIDEDIEGELNSLIIEERFNLNDVEYKNKLLELINQLVKV